jgi:hypothetical protein
MYQVHMAHILNLIHESQIMLLGRLRDKGLLAKIPSQDGGGSRGVVFAKITLDLRLMDQI